MHKLDASPGAPLTQTTVERFRAALHGQLLTPEDGDYDEAGLR
jgi:hypothetical protein